MKRAEIARVLNRFEARPLDRDRVDVAAIALGAGLGYLDYRFGEEAWRQGRPRLAKWYGDFAARTSMAATRPPV